MGEDDHASQLLPGDESWTADKALVADLSELNAHIARYVVRQLDVDAGRAEPVKAHDEDELGRKLTELGERVQHRAALRTAEARGPAINGEVAAPPAPEPGPDMDNGP